MNQQVPSIESLTQRLIQFRDERDWAQFHSIKELILSLNLEAAELLELTQWQSANQFEESIQEQSAQMQLQQECADVFIYLLLIAQRAGFDLRTAASEKISANALKYPVDIVHGKAGKPDKLDRPAS